MTVCRGGAATDGVVCLMQTLGWYRFCQPLFLLTARPIPAALVPRLSLYLLSVTIAFYVRPLSVGSDAVGDLEGSPFAVSLWDVAWAEDKSPLLDGCGCYACSKFTRAYLRHLLATHEMLAQVSSAPHGLSLFPRTARKAVCLLVTSDAHHTFRQLSLPPRPFRSHVAGPSHGSQHVSL